MGIDINTEIIKAITVMARYRMERDDEIEIVRILLSAGVEHCLQEQEKIRAEKDATIGKAGKSFRGFVH